jgi:hypothetical protein
VLSIPIAQIAYDLPRTHDLRVIFESFGDSGPGPNPALAHVDIDGVPGVYDRNADAFQWNPFPTSPAMVHFSFDDVAGPTQVILVFTDHACEQEQRNRAC